jgi:hypothetical protein
MCANLYIKNVPVGAKRCRYLLLLRFLEENLFLVSKKGMQITHKLVK